MIDSVLNNSDLANKFGEVPEERFELLGPDSPKYSETFVTRRKSEGREFSQEYEQHCRDKGIKILERELKPFERHDINNLKLLKSGVPLMRNMEIVIPLINHPDVKPPRWCHAELALVPTKRSLNVLFFETE